MVMSENVIKTGRPDMIEALVADLGSSDGPTREQARLALVEIGPPAVGPLINALIVRNNPTYWEAAKALSQMGSPESVPALVQALEDEEPGIRWLAAEGLIRVGRAGLEALLQALVSRPASAWLREGVHHVLHHLLDRGALDRAASEQVTPVLKALNGIVPGVEAPMAAHAALQALKHK